MGLSCFCCHARRERSGFVLLIAALAISLAACTSKNDTDSIQTGPPGVTDAQIRIGSSLALGGHAGYLGTQMLQGAMAYIRHINSLGGVHGRRIEVIAYDDGYDPPQCLYNTQKLIIDDQVFSLFNYVGTPTTLKVLPLINDAGIPLVGMFTGAIRLRQPVNRYLFNIRASYYQEIEAAVDYLVTDLMLERIAVFYQYDEFGFDGLRGTEFALKKHGLKPVEKGSYIRGSLDIQDGLNRIKASRAEAVVMIGTYDPCAKFILSARESGFSPMFHTVSFVGSEALAKRLGSHGNGVIITQVVPPPVVEAIDNVQPGVLDYSRLLTRYFPESKPNFVGLEGYLNARVLVEGFRRAGPDLSREGFITALESVKDLDLGISNRLSFDHNDHQGLDRVYFTQIQENRLTLLK